MTEAVNDFNQVIEAPTVQCSLCLHDITLPLEETPETKKGYVQCPLCDYHQPTTKGPRRRDMIVFGVTIAVVYLATISAVLLSR